MEIPEHRPFKHREGIPSRLHESSRAATKERIMSVTSADARHRLRAVQRVPTTATGIRPFRRRPASLASPRRGSRVKTGSA